jgi:anaerobic magnesium-protoporphyrin IX monomethyl ester cyclase
MEGFMRVVLINSPLKSIVCDQGVGHQMPLGLLMVGGPLIDAGHQVKLIDAACDHLSDAEIVQAVEDFHAEIAMIAHVGSTSAHLCCLRILQSIKTAHPQTITIYGGVHPTYHDRSMRRLLRQISGNGIIGIRLWLRVALYQRSSLLGSSL